MNDKQRAPIESVIVEWEPGVKYVFRGESLVRKDLKKVWLGRFIKNAPAGLSCTADYCLKQISVNVNDYTKSARYPACREYFDLFTYSGDHLRQILAKNPAAVQVERDLRRTGEVTKSYPPCFSVEPAYQTLTDWFRNCGERTVEERLDLIRQFAEGCQELRREENKIYGRMVDAHRDIKSNNAVLDQVDGSSRVRLVDFASIHLERETAAERRPVRRTADETLGTMMSRQNTAPEDLRFTGWKVGPTTDVYALGMLLANMFLVDRKGEYFNPNYAWIDCFWPQDKADVESKDKQMSEEFHRCWQDYDKGANSEESWIEQALRARGAVFGWEDMADGGILQCIRRLFVRATRIDPEQRIPLEDYLQELEQIIEMCRGADKKIPVSLYLFERTDVDRYAADYQQAALRVFQEERDQALRKGNAVPRARCVKYHRRLPGQSLAESRAEVRERPCKDEQELAAYIRSIPKINGNGRDMTIHALLDGCSLDPESGYFFSGNVYLFAREIPEESQMEPVRVDNVEYDIARICHAINLGWETMVSIEAHTILAPDEDCEEPRWCSHSPIRTGAPRQQNTQPPDRTRGSRDGWYEELYVLLPDGSKFLL